MGLDMYLYAELYVSGHKFRPEHTAMHAMHARIIEATGITPCDDSPSFEVRATVGYWRKANAIHRWFVEKVQGGKDDCGKYDVSREQLVALRADCQRVLDVVETVPGKLSTGTTYHGDGRITQHTQDGSVVAQAGIAASVLPTQSGCFFGSTDYDEFYLNDLRHTVEIIDRVLSDPTLSNCDFSYRSSW